VPRSTENRKLARVGASTDPLMFDSLFVKRKKGQCNQKGKTIKPK